MQNAVTEFLSENLNDLIVGLISTFICFVIAFTICSIHQIKISKKICLGVNIKKGEEKRLAWKFKIVNKSIITKFVNFDTKLVGINYIRTSDNTVTQHRDNIEVIAGIRELTRFIPRPILYLIRLKNPEYNISFAYRPVTFNNLSKMINEYEELELSISCNDTLTGRTHLFKQRYPLSKRSIVIGNFTNDGRLNKILPLTEIESEFVKEHENAPSKESEKKDTNQNSTENNYYYKNHVSIKIELEIDESIDGQNHTCN